MHLKYVMKYAPCWPVPDPSYHVENHHITQTPLKSKIYTTFWNICLCVDHIVTMRWLSCHTSNCTVWCLLPHLLYMHPLVFM